MRTARPGGGASMRLTRSAAAGAPGACRRFPLPCRSHATGFTLIEILVVVAIVAIIISVALLSVNIGGGARVAEREARRFAALTELACERAGSSGHDYGVHLSLDGYAFSRAQAKTWETERDGELRTRHWPAGFAIEITREGHAVELAKEFKEDPQLTCAASGEMSPFRARVAASVEAVYDVTGAIDGSLTVAAATP